jgi:hypothetical protein
VAALVVALAGLLVLAAPAALSAADDPTADAVRAVQSFRFGSVGSKQALDRAIEAGGVKLAALAPFLKDASVQRRWPAMYIADNVASSGADLRLLQPGLRDPDPSIRALAAFALLANGHKDAIPALIGLLRSERMMSNSDPPVRLAHLAGRRLTFFTGADFGFDADGPPRARARAIARWEGWWRKVGRQIRWDAPAHTYRWPGQRRTSGLVGEPPRRPAAHAVTPSGSGDTVTITIKLQLSGTSVRGRAAQQKALAVINAAVALLNGTGRTGECLKLVFKVEAEIRPAGRAPRMGYNQIRVGPNQWKDEYGVWRQSYMDYLPTKLGDTPGGFLYWGDLTDQDAAQIVAHELAHLLGLNDEYGENRKGFTNYDPGSFLADVNGAFLQRQLDWLAEHWAKGNKHRCERWTLSVSPWKVAGTPYVTVSGDVRTHHIALLSSARLSADFLVDPSTGVVKPAAERPCGMLNLTKRCDDVKDGASTMLVSRVIPGDATCGPLELLVLPPDKHFQTVVTGGSRSGRTLRVKLFVRDREALLGDCHPPLNDVPPSLSRIRSSMEDAGALDFTVTLAGNGRSAAKSFRAAKPHKVAYGTVKLTRLS